MYPQRHLFDRPMKRWCAPSGYYAVPRMHGLLAFSPLARKQSNLTQRPARALT